MEQISYRLAYTKIDLPILKVLCIRTDRIDGFTFIYAPIIQWFYPKITGPSAAPRVSFRVVNSTAIAFSWETPFFFPNVSDILFYTLSLYSRARSQDRKEWTVSQSTSGVSHTHVVTSDAVATACEQLVLEVSTTNVVGTSPTRSVTGGFPIGKCPHWFFFLSLFYSVRDIYA